MGAHMLHALVHALPIHRHWGAFSPIQYHEPACTNAKCIDLSIDQKISCSHCTSCLAPCNVLCGTRNSRLFYQCVAALVAPAKTYPLEPMMAERVCGKFFLPGWASKFGILCMTFVREVAFLP